MKRSRQWIMTFVLLLLVVSGCRVEPQSTTLVKDFDEFFMIRHPMISKEVAIIIDIQSRGPFLEEIGYNATIDKETGEVHTEYSEAMTGEYKLGNDTSYTEDHVHYTKYHTKTVAEQQAALRESIDRGVGIIYLLSADNKAIHPLLKEAKKKGIYLVGLSDYEKDVTGFYVTYDYRYEQYVADNLIMKSHVLAKIQSVVRVENEGVVFIGPDELKDEKDKIVQRIEENQAYNFYNTEKSLFIDINSKTYQEEIEAAVAAGIRIFHVLKYEEGLAFYDYITSIGYPREAFVLSVGVFTPDYLEPGVISFEDTDALRSKFDYVTSVGVMYPAFTMLSTYPENKKMISYLTNEEIYKESPYFEVKRASSRFIRYYSMKDIPTRSMKKHSNL